MTTKSTGSAAAAISGIALITGGSRGLGRAAALHLAKAGWDVVITYHSRADLADATVGEIHALGRKAFALRLDTGATAQFPGFAASLQEILKSQFGRDAFDALVNNAGNGAN
ncbi:MAG: SDR family NAD(P)-dependent oxidoreductase, partial [Pseudomonadota bacterium]|nr:SDR family NAD(P)-dependent oxidoreductase [Pseudomonadota bacterium]